jgi:hypothetical protein
MSDPLLPWPVRFVFGGAFLAVAPLIWHAILGHLRTGKVQLPRGPLFDRQRQAVDFWITIAFAALASVGVIGFGVAILLGWLPGESRPRAANSDSSRPQVDGLLVPMSKPSAK